jgi:hypothetical protein
MKKKYKLLGVLLGSVWFSLNETYGDFANLLNTIQSESLGQSAINKVTIERDATIKAISAMIGAVDKYKDKNAAEIEQFARIFSAILWSSPQASTTILIQKEDASQPAKLENSIYQEIQTSLANVLKSENSEVVWNSFAKNTESGSLNTALNSFRSIPGLSLGTTLKSNNVDSTAVVKDSQTRPADNTSTKTNTFSGITTLEYSGQNLSLYSDLISISVTVSQLNSSKDIESNKSLEIRVIGDATDTTLSTQHLVVPRAKIDMSQVTNLTEVIVKLKIQNQLNYLQPLSL